MVTTWEEREVSPGTSLISVDGKLRGSRARQLMDQLESISCRRGSEQVSRVVLDLRSVVSIDSLGTAAFDTALESGLKLDLVLRRGFELDDGREATELTQRGLRVYDALDKALGTHRSTRVMTVV